MRKRGEKISVKRGESSSNVIKDLSAAQVEVLDMLRNEFMTVKQIAQRRGTRLNSVYKIINKLIKKGHISRGYTRGLKKERGGRKTTPHSPGSWRVHAQHFNLGILHKSAGYDAFRLRKNLLFLDGNTVKLHDDVVEVYAGELLWFWGASPSDAECESFKYWIGFFGLLERRINCLLVKEGVGSVKMNMVHFAHVEDDVAEDYVKRGQSLKVYAHEDGKLAILVDRSLGVPELEFLHPKTGKRDAERISVFLEGLRRYEGFTPEFIMRSFGGISMVSERNTAHIQEILEILKKLVKEGGDV